MGPSVKFVLPIIDAFPDKKNGGNFLCGKKGQTGGGLSLGRTFSRHSFLDDSLSRESCLEHAAVSYPSTLCLPLVCLMYSLTLLSAFLNRS